MEQAKTQIGIFPKIKDIFVTRRILQFVQRAELFTKIYFLCKQGHELAMDCSLLKEIVFGKDNQGYTYDCEDFFQFFLAKLTRPQELRKLDFHYYYRGDELSPIIMKKLMRFTKLEELRFGEHCFSKANLDAFNKLTLDQVTHITIPLFPDPVKGKEFLDVLKKKCPKLDSITYEDSNFEGPSSTQASCEKLAEIGIEHLRWRIHESSNKESMADMISKLYPLLKTMHIISLQPQTTAHQEALDKLLGENGKLKNLRLKCVGGVSNYEIKWEVSSLEHFYTQPITDNYETLTKFLEQNSKLKYFKLKHPTKQPHTHGASLFRLSNLQKLIYLNIGGEFTVIALENLPSLQVLSIKFLYTRFKLVAWEGQSLLLVSFHATANYENELLIVDKYEANSKAVKEARLCDSKVKFQGFFQNATYLRSSELQFINRHAGSKSLLRFEYQVPKDVPIYIDEIIPTFLQNFPSLKQLKIDATDIKEQSLGKIELDCPTLVSFHLHSVQQADDQIIISKHCTALKEFSMVCTRSKKLRIFAPNIERVVIDGLNGYEPGELEIQADNGYYLHLSRTVVHLEKCKGFSTLVIQDNWSGEKDPFTAEFNEPNYYSHFKYFEGRGLAQYSNEFFHSFAKTAPQLERIHIQFNECLRFEDEVAGDNVVHIKHPNIKWVNLLKGDTFFKGIRIDPECKRLQLVKFRDFELEDFYNDGGIRFWSEKNLLRDEDF